MTRTSWLLAIEMVAIAAALIVSLDLREHGRVAPLGGVNEWGYRGPVARQRQPNEVRIAIVGGTRAFGWGVPASALPAELRRLIMLTTDRAGGDVRPIVVVNLGRMGALPGAYPEIIEHYAYLRPDFVCLYDDLGVQGGSPLTGTAHTSGIYQLTGYAPALPLVSREKGMALRFGDVQRGYASAASGPDSSASLVQRVAGSALQSAGQALAGVDQALSSVVSRSQRSERRTTYVDEMMEAIESAHRHARGVVVVTSPADTVEQRVNSQALQPRLERLAGSESWLRRVNLGEDARLSSDAELRLDGWNYSSAGVAAVAARIVPALLSLVQ